MAEVYSSGFYRVDPATGEHRVYGPRDGFALGGYEPFDGLWLDGRICLATARGLAVVTPRP